VCEPRQGREAAALSIPSRRRGLTSQSPARFASHDDLVLHSELRVATAGKAGSGAADVVGYSRLALLGRIAQRESARFTRGRSLVRSQVRPSSSSASKNLPRPRLLSEGSQLRLSARRASAFKSASLRRTSGMRGTSFPTSSGNGQARCRRYCAPSTSGAAAVASARTGT
jgi:hypothetical protein